MIATLYVPGPSPLHRVPAPAKLLVLAALGTGAFLVAQPVPLAAGAATIGAAYPLGRVPLRGLWTQARDLAPLLALMAAAQMWVAGGEVAAATTARVLGLVWAAGLITATTPFSAMMDSLTRALGPLRRLGVNPDRVGFALTMTVRFVPLLHGMLAETRAAQSARGLGRNPVALAVPLTIRAIRLAERVAEAVEARGALDTCEDMDDRKEKENERP